MELSDLKKRAKKREAAREHNRKLMQAIMNTAFEKTRIYLKEREDKKKQRLWELDFFLKREDPIAYFNSIWNKAMDEERNIPSLNQ